MPEIDEFATALLEEAKRFYEKAADADDESAALPNLHAALMLGFCGLEAHVNAIVEDFSGRNEISIHDRGILLERDVQFKNGEFKLGSALKIARLEDRMQLLYRRFSNKAIDKDLKWWTELAAATDLRNKITHPKTHPKVTTESVKRGLQAIIDAIDALFRAVYKKKFPGAARGVSSKLTFYEALARS